MRWSRLVTSTSKRNFVLIPAVVLAAQAVARRPVHLAWTPLMVWGYLQYRLTGDYRTRLGGGGPGVTIPPDRIVSTGPYAYTRNPMYLGHLVFLAGLALATRSPLAMAALAANVPWFDRHARQDEERLLQRFGDDYAAYRDRVPRWRPRLPDR